MCTVLQTCFNREIAKIYHFNLIQHIFVFTLLFVTHIILKRLEVFLLKCFKVSLQLFQYRAAVEDNGG